MLKIIKIQVRSFSCFIFKPSYDRFISNEALSICDRNFQHRLFFFSKPELELYDVKIDIDREFFEIILINNLDFCKKRRYPGKERIQKE